MAKLVFLGLSITSSWGNGHATTYRALLKALARRGHDLLFLERDVPWYAQHRDLVSTEYCRIALYENLTDLDTRFAADIRDADAVIVGSFVPDGIGVGLWALKTALNTVAFYDIDTPATLFAVESGKCEYLTVDLIKRYDLYLSFTGGPVLAQLKALGARKAAPLYCSADPDLHRVSAAETRWRLGYLGTYSPDRQEGLERLLLQPAYELADERFAVAGAQYPRIDWPPNVQHIAHLPPDEHPAFYCSQLFTLNLTRADMRVAGYSPSVRLFEAAACGTPVISDSWNGLECFFAPGTEILVVEDTPDVLRILRDMGADERRAIGAAARRRVLAFHTAEHRAAELERLLANCKGGVSTILAMTA